MRVRCGSSEVGEDWIKSEKARFYPQILNLQLQLSITQPVFFEDGQLCWVIASSGRMSYLLLSLLVYLYTIGK